MLCFVCAVSCSRINCTCAEGRDVGNVMETAVMSVLEGVGLVVSRSECLCCVVLCVCSLV